MSEQVSEAKRLKQVGLGLYRNIKSGLVYSVEGFATNATNDTKGKFMVIYRDSLSTYVRDKEEFKNKFEKVISTDEDFPGEGWQ